MLEKRGRFWAAEPVFPPPRSDDGGRHPRASRRITLGSNRLADRGGEAARAGDLVLVGQARRGDGRAQITRVLGRPDVARDLIEGLLLDRGLARGFDPAVEREARAAAARKIRATDGRRDLTGPADVHDRPGERTRLRRRDLRRTPRRGSRPRPRSCRRRGPRQWRGFHQRRPRTAADARVGSHRGRQRLRARGLARRSGGQAPRHERLRAGRGRADAAGGALERRLLARAGEGARGGDGRARAARSEGREGLLLPLADPLGRALELRAGRSDLRRRRARRARPGPSRWPPRARRRPRSRRIAAGATAAR